MRVEPVLEMSAPAERLATFRILSSGFITLYLLVRLPVFLGLADRPASAYDPVGLLALVDVTPPSGVVNGLALGTLVLGVPATLGWRHRVVGPMFAVGVLLLTTLRSSGGQLLHFENLMALFSLVLAIAPAADVWSLDARRREQRPSDAAVRYGHPLVVASVMVVTTYVIAGIAKLRYGGLGWIDGDTLRNHVASAAARLDLLGGTPAPLAELAVRADGLLVVAAIATVLLELGAPLALVDRRLRNGWVVAVWAMHVGILLTMAIGFPSPLFGVAFAPLFRLEDGARALADRVARIRSARGHRPTLRASGPGR